MEHKESKYITRDGIDIFYQVWKPEGTPKGIVQLVHGLAEHAGRYMHVINKLVPEGYIIYGDDHRGHGRSGGHKGFVKSIQEFVLDQKEFTKIIKDKEGVNLPLFLLGHSMGSLISILYISDYPNDFKGRILSGTGSAVGEGVNWFTILLAKTMSKILPKMTLKNELSDGVSRDPAVKEAYNNDPYVLDKITTKLGTEIFTGLKVAKSSIGNIKIPILVQKGGEDPLIIKTEELMKNVTTEDSTLKMYEGLFHEVYNELEEDREVVLNDLNEWLNSHL
ncbi:MAG: alpha/beta hydrolase [Candidatus Hodarchaeales archaeon]|jgi:alpha-beta hydrolase superfamily lysophospholipase